MTRLSCRICRLAILVVAAASSGFYIGCYWTVTSSYIFPWDVCNRQATDVDFRRQNAQQLRDVALQLKGSSGVSARSMLALNHVIAQLDPRAALSSDEQLRRREAVADTCGEEYRGAAFGHPFYREGFMPAADCRPEQKRPLHELVTALLLTLERGAAPLDHALAPLRALHPRLPVAVAAAAHAPAPPAETVVVRARVHDFATPGALLNRLVQKVRTPYVLVARDAVRVDELARVERLVHVISALGRDAPASAASAAAADDDGGWGVAVAGGAVRDPRGHWSAGCLQTRLRIYALRLRRGYRYSALDCMLCDHLRGPFVARASLMREVPFNEHLPAAVVFEDWFLRVKGRGALAASCPDSLFFVGGDAEAGGGGGGGGGEGSGAREAWRLLARAWHVDRVLLPEAPPLRFSCAEVTLSCDVDELNRKGMLVPSCCLQQVAGALSAFKNFARKHGFDYELNEGTLLGAVKLSSFLPWDVDGDILIKFQDFHKYKENKAEMGRLGYDFVRFTETADYKYFTFLTPDVSVDMWCRHNLSAFLLPKEVSGDPTRVKIMGLWMRGPWNPGLLARNRYGPGYLKHAQHWKKLGLKHHMDKYSVGEWGKCSLPNHHGCLNRYPVEGSFDLLSENCP